MFVTEWAETYIDQYFSALIHSAEGKISVVVIYSMEVNIRVRTLFSV